MNTFDTEIGIDVESSSDNAPSADFICAISEFLDTDPRDLLVELGYYNSEDSAEAQSAASSR